MKKVSRCILILFIFIFGCNFSAGTKKESQHKDISPPDSTELNNHNTIRIASWNIQNFGRSKATDPVRMAKIAEILKNYDIIAIQEISNVSEQNDPGCPRNENACPRSKNCHLIRRALEEYLNKTYNLHYEFVFSPQVKDERYLFIYNPIRVGLQEASLMVDPEDSEPICDSQPENTGKMVRQPFEGKFKVGSFDFILLTVHTSPKINLQELNGLDYFYKKAQTQGEPDVIIMGDLNADCAYFDESETIPLRNPCYIWIVPDTADTTVSGTDCAYDRIIFQDATLEDFTGNWGIVEDIPKSVSDHYLIWGEFWTDRDSN